MATAVQKFHEEEAIGKTYDWQVAKRLLRYLKPYLRLLFPALVLTLVLNLLGVLQHKITQYAIDWYILPRITNGLNLFVLAVFGVQAYRCVASYLHTVLLNTAGQSVMFDLRQHICDERQPQEGTRYHSRPSGP